MEGCIICGGIPTIKYIFPIIIDPGFWGKIKGEKYRETGVGVSICRDCLSLRRSIKLKGRNELEAIESLYHDYSYMDECIHEIV